jgi:hypothetical protein
LSLGPWPKRFLRQTHNAGIGPPDEDDDYEHLVVTPKRGLHAQQVGEILAGWQAAFKARRVVLDHVIELAALPPVNVPGDLVRKLLREKIRRTPSGEPDVGAVAQLAEEVGAPLRTLQGWLREPPMNFPLDHPILEHLPGHPRLAALEQEHEKRTLLHLEFASRVRAIAESRHLLSERERPALEDTLWLHGCADVVDAPWEGDWEPSLLQRLELARVYFREAHGREPRQLRIETRKRVLARIRAERAYFAKLVEEGERYEPFDAARIHDLTEAAIDTGHLSRGSRPRGYTPGIDWSAPEHNTWGRLSDPACSERVESGPDHNGHLGR